MEGFILSALVTVRLAERPRLLQELVYLAVQFSLKTKARLPVRFSGVLSLLRRLFAVIMLQAYGYDDHGISEMWMQTYMGEASSEPQEGSTASAQKAGVGQLGDQAIRVQVREAVLFCFSKLPALYSCLVYADWRLDLQPLRKKYGMVLGANPVNCADDI